MNIAVVTDGYDRVSAPIVNELCRRGHRLLLLVLGPRGPVSPMFSYDASIAFTGMPGPLSFLQAGRARRILYAFQADVVYFCLSRPKAYTLHPIQVLQVDAPERLASPMVGHCQSLFQEEHLPFSKEEQERESVHFYDRNDSVTDQATALEDALVKTILTQSQQ